MLSKVTLSRIETIKACVDQMINLEEAHAELESSEAWQVSSSKERRNTTEELAYQVEALDDKIGKQWNHLSGQQQVDAWSALGEQYQAYVDGY